VNERAAERSVRAITGLVWTDAVIVMVISATTTANLVSVHGGTWAKGFALGLAIDLALAAALIGDQAVHGLGEKSGWGAALRWITAGMSLVTNCAASAQQRDVLGVALHAIPPVLLVVLTEAAQQYRTALATVQHRRDEEKRRADARRVTPQQKPTPAPVVSPVAPPKPKPAASPAAVTSPATRAATVTELHPEQGTKKDRGRAWLIRQVVEHQRDPQQITAAEVDRAIEASGYSKKFIDDWRTDAVAAKQAALAAVN
jgi:hypothetical protein